MYNPSAPISPQPATNQTTTPPKPKIKLNLKPLGKVVGVGIVFLVLYIVTIFISSVISSFSENVSISGLTTSFNPLITIAYILVFYSVSFYYSLTKKQAYNYLLLALFLSFTINFVEGSMILVALAPILHKLKLIETTA